jgi:hypothetical protein
MMALEYETDSDSPRYAIDPGWLDQQGRSMRALAIKRFCAESRRRIGEPIQRQQAQTNASGKVVFKTEESTYGDNPFDVIAECCALKPDYIHRQLPLMEMLFRLFLASGNAPLTIEELQLKLQEHYIDAVRDLSERTLQRMLDSDDFYGIQRSA